MKLKTHSIALALRNRIVSRGVDDERPADARRPPATNEEPQVRILDFAYAQDVPEAGQEGTEYQQTDQNPKPKDTLWFYLLGATILYLLALIIILFG